MITSLLIANRGEIALRVMRTARRMGIRTVAICTDLDASAPHVRAADAAVTVPSYLDIEAVVDAARSSGATAIHPGYGFLSERPELARAVEAAGLKLVGPSSDVMEQMGRKDAARKIAMVAGVPVVPSYPLEAVDEMVFPVLVKAAAGGGGKGMRIVRRAEDYADAVAAARRESLTAFGDDTLLVEKYVESGRHIEVQVLADAHGNVVHLFERDCSTQRRHQKVLEEAPAPTITEETRNRVTSSAVAMAAEVGYENAGTVEFLLDNASTRDGTGEPAFYFLEMNTRLQVEHPVTELTVEVAGRPLDLVELQLRVAAGEPLSFGQDDVRQHGHAIEARVYAEDPFAGFLPQAGTATIVRWPDTSEGAITVRVDAALESGQVVSTSYDPMLGKVIAHGPDREAARRALVAALDRTAVLGFATNTGFLRVLAASDEFRGATIDTAWLDRAGSEGAGSEGAGIAEPGVDVARIIAAWTDVAVRAMTAGPPHPFAADGWRSGAPAAPELVALDEVLAVRRADGTVRDAAGEHRVHQLLAEQHTVVLDVDGARHWAVVNVGDHDVEVVHEGQRHVFERPDVFGDHGPAAGDGTLLAPMPGTLLSVDVAEGDHVVEGQRLGVLEAMKMELSLTAPFDGTVIAVGAATGDQVQLKQVLFEVAASSGVEP
jgi:3-methylcrotonyl-CoA carboxylase alpha subunit/acetyl-CoA/propionyl-CoA carboxylase biotin carboxyl carrier protein